MGALRVAVVGVGQLGRHHARLLASIPDVELVGVFDLNRQRAEEIAAGVKTSVLVDLAALPGQVDAVTVAVPTESHAAVALPTSGYPVPVSSETSRNRPPPSLWKSVFRHWSFAT